MKKHLLLLIIFSFLGASSIFAQLKNSFSEDRVQFLKELGEFVNQSKRAEIDKILKDFTLRFNSLPEANSKQVMGTCNAMLAMKMTATPFFTDYLECIVDIGVVESDHKRFEEWNAIVDAMIKDIQQRKFESVRRFLDFSKNFMEKSTLHYADLTANWYCSNKDYKLKYENQTPSVVWEKLTLTALYKTDSISIIETKGYFLPLTNQWKGTGGKVQWKRFEKDETYCELYDYTLDASKNFYKAEKVKLHYPTLFPDKDIEGTFEDKLTVKNPQIEISYPRFESFDKQLKINNLGGTIQYQGGFRLQGTTAFGYGTKDNKSLLTMNDSKRGNRNFKAFAENFTIRKGEYISSERVECSIYFGKDSIYHPSVNMRIDIVKNELKLERGQRGSDRNPFSNSYHKVNIDVGKIIWNIDKDSLIVGDKYPGFGINNNNGMFESYQFFSEPDFRRIQNIATTNPIAIMKLYSDKMQTRTFSADVIAKQLGDKMDASMIQSLFYDLSSQGFIKYDIDKQQIELQNKLFHFAAAYQKKSDFDVLRVSSETKKENAFFSLQDTNILVNGVKGIELSNKQRVRISPKREEVIFKKNRDFDFDGRLFAGYGLFYGDKYQFHYDQFEIRTDSARFLDLYLQTGLDKNGKPIATVINSRLEHLKGILLIDAPNNKSGREDIKMFPSFQTKDYSYVYYDDKAILDSVYKRDNFFFKLDKFNLDGMDSLKKDDLKFKGTMRPADIVPDFRETLVLQRDSSLGFITQTPESGFPLYKGKGNYKGEINLSNKGFLASGTVKYLDATIDSKDVVFMPNQMKASAKSFELKENKENNTPKVVSPSTDINWKPYADSMYMTARDSAFRFFQEQSYTLRSTIIMTPGGVKGKGTFDWDKGTLSADLYSFGWHSVQSDSMNMSIRALGKNDAGTGNENLAFDTKNIRGKIDFEEQKGKFKSNSDVIQTYMPGVKYKTSINEFEWDLKAEEIAFKSDGREAAFLCVDPEQDSLKYNGTRAAYDLKGNILKVGGVPFVQTCDAYIYPDKEVLQVELGGKMTTFTNAKIVCDTLTKHHVINKATVNIKGKKLYEAQGLYEYNVPGKDQEIKFDNIVGQRVGKGSRAEKKTETRGTGSVLLEDEFKMDLKTSYKGQIALFSNSKNLKFEGFARLDHENLPSKEWFSINCFADRKDLSIAFQNPKNEGGEPLFSGIYISKENNAAYPRVMMPLTFRKDRNVIDVKGLIRYNAKTDEVILGDSAKLLTNAPQGNKLVFNNKNAVVTAEGKLNIGSGLQYVTLKAAGKAQTKFLKKEESRNDSTGMVSAPLTLEAMIGLDFLVPDKLLKIMMADIQSGSFDASDIDYNKDDFHEKALTEFISDSSDYRKIVANMKNKTLELGSYNKFNMVFSKVPLKWNQETQSFISNSKKADLNSIAGINLNKNILTFMEFRMPSNEDDRAYVYIKTANDYFYFFGYQRGILSMTSNNQKLEEEFNKIKPKERIKKMADNQPFEIQWVETGTAEMFLRRITNAQK
jgi:hypothetical protein